MPSGMRPLAPDDAMGVASAAKLLDRFNREFEEESPGPEVLAERLRSLLGEGATIVLLAGEGPDGVLVMRRRPALWSRGAEVYIQELYVAPEARRRGYGRDLMERAIELAREAGADYVELGTEEDDTEARTLYESLGFTNRDRGQLMFVYELEL